MLININNFIKGSYYYCYLSKNYNVYFICKCIDLKYDTENKLDQSRIIGTGISNMSGNYSEFKFFPDNIPFCLISNDRIFRLANFDEVIWLEECIRQNKFVSKEEALKLFKSNADDLTNFNIQKIEELIESFNELI